MEDFDWQPMDTNNIPECQGIYGIRAEPEGFWFYIGKAQNIAKRMATLSHPYQISISLDRSFSYWFIPCSDNFTRLERAAIKRFQPIGNGGTSGWSEHYLMPFNAGDCPSSKNRVTPHGHVCRFQDPKVVKEEKRLAWELLKTLDWWK